MTDLAIITIIKEIDSNRHGPVYLHMNFHHMTYVNVAPICSRRLLVSLYINSGHISNATIIFLFVLEKNSNY